MPNTQNEFDSNQAEFDALTRDLVMYCSPEVERIESSLETTPNHYVDYFNLLRGGLNQGHVFIYVVASTLVEAGANRQGVIDALKALGLDVERDTGEAH